MDWIPIASLTSPFEIIIIFIILPTIPTQISSNSKSAQQNEVRSVYGSEGPCPDLHAAGLDHRRVAGAPRQRALDDGRDGR
jgi:hypothetical protein